MPQHKKRMSPRRRRSRSYSLSRSRSLSPRQRSRSRTPTKMKRRSVSPRRKGRSRSHSPGSFKRFSRSPQRRSRPLQRKSKFSPKWSHSPEQRRPLGPQRRSRSPKFHSHNRKRSWSRSPQRRRSKSVTPPYLRPGKHGRSPPRKLSRSPPMRHSRSPRRRSRSPLRKQPMSPRRSRSTSPGLYERYEPARRSGSSAKRPQKSFRSLSRSPSPVAKKSSKGSRMAVPSHDRSRSPRSQSPLGGKMYADTVRQKSKSEHVSPQKKTSSKSKKEIAAVYIVPTKRMEKLNDRFQTLEQIAQGPFEPDENITIGIHRGHHLMKVDKDVPVDYDFNPKTFVMRYPKKDYSKAIFNRDEILAFHHDDILDDQAYVEKRTVTMAPSARSADSNYKITIGGADGKFGAGDRRMVRDQRGSHRSRLDRPSQPVTVRLDPKPDPRYESIFKRSQKQSDSGEREKEMQDKMLHNPNDLRYSLSRKRHGSPDSDSDPVDARKKIDARRGKDRPPLPTQKELRDLNERLTNRGDDGRIDRGRDRWKEKEIPRQERRISSISSERSPERKRSDSGKREESLPDFKNRPGKFNFDDWKDKPEMIPKGSAYFEHDNRERDDMNFWERKQRFLEMKKRGLNPPYPARGDRGDRGSGTRFISRGGFRGNYRGFPRTDRGRGRGGFRPFRARGSYTWRARGTTFKPFKTFRDKEDMGNGEERKSSSAIGEWKHDMFDRLEKNDGEKTSNADDRASNK